LTRCLAMFRPAAPFSTVNRAARQPKNAVVPGF